MKIGKIMAKSNAEDPPSLQKIKMGHLKTD
jgi:hypothetical protein